MMEMMKMLVYVPLVAMVKLSLSDAVIHNYLHIIKSSAIARINQYNAVHTGRYRREAHTMTEKEKSEVVDAHNYFRRLDARESASDIELMTWDDTLESMAVRWAAHCKFDHGNPKEEPKLHGWVGQNIFAKDHKGINLTSAIQVFYNEKRYYHYDSVSCDPGKVCGHYTQVVWATSLKVACAYHNCKKNGHYWVFLVCNYHPGGNYRGRKPYKRAASCSQCANGAGWCRDRLCDRNCSTAEDGCTCAAYCYNCAKLDLKTCRCSCAAGWRGTDCSMSCEKKRQKCTPDPNAKPDQCPVVKGPGAYEYTFSPASSMYVKSQHQQLMMMMMVLVMIISNIIINNPVGLL